MAQEIQTYLNTMEDKFKSYQSQHPKTNLLNKVKDLNSSVLNQIGNQIIQSRILIPEQQKKLKIKTIQPENQAQINKMDQKYHQIQQKKKAILDQLHEIQLMESSIKFNRSTFKHSNSSSQILKKSKVKSEFTQEDLTKIRQIYKKQKKFKNKIQMGIKKYEENLEKFKKEKEQQQKEKHRQLCLQRHQQRQKYIQQIEERNKKRQQLLKQEHQKILELKKKQKLFQKLQSKFLEEKQIQAEEMKQKLHQYKKKRQFSFDDMKIHQEKYLERKRIQDEQRENKVKNFKDPNESKFPCLFLDRIKEQKERMRHQSEEKKEIIRNFVEKKSAFAESVRKNLHEKIKTLSQSKLTVMKDSTISSSPKWLNTPQKYEQGTKYMREINAKIAKLPRKAVEKNDEEKKPKFKNYLADIKAQKTENKSSEKPITVNNFVSQIGILEAKQNITTHNLAKSIKAKLELMNKLQQMK